MEDRKQVVRGIIKFLLHEMESSDFDADRKESLEVAVQCLETSYDLDGQRDVPCDVDLNKLLEGKSRRVVSDADKSMAELCKNKGNDSMKGEDYAGALKEYTQAIELDPYNAIYYCNRAAAFNKLGQYDEVIADCETAIRLDPMYGKAYGRLGIAYSNLNRFADAKNAYMKAAQLDPSNPTYKANLKLAESKIAENLDMSQYMTNPNLLNIASQMLNDPQFHNMMSGIISGADSQDSSINTLLQAGAQLAARMETTNPSFVENLRRTIDVTQQQQQQSQNPNQQDGQGSQNDEH